MKIFLDVCQMQSARLVLNPMLRRPDLRLVVPAWELAENEKRDEQSALIPDSKYMISDCWLPGYLSIQSVIF